MGSNSSLPKGDGYELKQVENKFVFCNLPLEVSQSTVENGQGHSCIFVCLEMACYIDRNLSLREDIPAICTQLDDNLALEDAPQSRLHPVLFDLLTHGIKRGNHYAERWKQKYDRRLSVGQLPTVPEVIDFMNHRSKEDDAEDNSALNLFTNERSEQKIHTIHMITGRTENGEEVCRRIQKACTSDLLKNEEFIYIILISVDRAILLVYVRTRDYLLLIDPHKRKPCSEPQTGAVIALAKYDHLSDFCLWIFDYVYRIPARSAFEVDCVEIIHNDAGGRSATVFQSPSAFERLSSATSSLRSSLASLQQRSRQNSGRSVTVPESRPLSRAESAATTNDIFTDDEDPAASLTRTLSVDFAQDGRPKKGSRVKNITKNLKNLFF